MGLSRAMIVMVDADENLLTVHSSVGPVARTGSARPLAVGRRRDRARLRQWHAGGGARRGAGPEFIDRTGAFSAQGDRMMAFVVVPLKTDRRWSARWPRSARCRAARGCPTTSAS
jgi:Nif-specific regulatory protein